MTIRTFDAIVIGSGPFAAISAIRLAARFGPERTMFATSDAELGGTGFEMLVADLADGEAFARLDPFIVAEWDRFALIDGDQADVLEGRTCLLDPGQVRAEFLDSCAGMTVLKQVRMARVIEGYLIVDGNIHAAETILSLPGGHSGDYLVGEGVASAGLEYPVLLDAQPASLRQVIPAGRDRILVKSMPLAPCRDDSGGIDLTATFAPQLSLVNRVPD